MSEQTQTPVAGAPSAPAAPDAAEPGVAHVGETASVGRVLRDQRKTLYVAAAFVVASLWVITPFGGWTLSGCVAAGVVLGLANHLATELWLLRIITGGREPSRNQMIAATVIRLATLTAVAVAITVVFWSDGIGVLFGLAIFRLVALMMTSLTLLKELKS